MRTSKLSKRILLYVAGLLIFIPTAVVILKSSSISLPLYVGFLMPKDVNASLSKLKDGPCGPPQKTCPVGMVDFFVSSGAGNVVAPKICIQNELVLGSVKNNAGRGINVVVLNGRTPEVVKAFSMYSADPQPFIEFLQGLERGNIVVMATHGEAGAKLNDQVRNLIESLGSSSIKSLLYRDNWVFVGGKGDIVQGLYEKHIKNDAETNKYDGWPERVELDGCVPLYDE